MNQISHFAQNIKTGRFQHFDPDLFKKVNGTDERRPQPLDYNLKNVRAPVALYYSDKDWISGVADTKKLAGELPNVIKEYPIHQKRFNHMDILWGIDAKQYIFDEILRTINTANTTSNMPWEEK